MTRATPFPPLSLAGCLRALALCLCLGIGLAAAREDDVRLELARKLAEKGEYDKSVQELRLYLNDHPDAREIYGRIGTLRMQQGNYKLAAENFKLALAKLPDWSEARQGLANAYEKAGEREKAREEWKRLAQSRDPAWKRKAESRLQALEGNQPDTLAKPARIPPPSSDRPAASEAVRAGRPGDGAYAPALDAGPNPAGESGIYAQKSFQEAVRLYREKKTDSALTALRHTLSHSPGHPGAFYLGGVIRYEKGDYAKAAFNFKRGVDYPGRGVNAHFYLGRIYQRQEREGDAIAAYERYLRGTASPEGRRQAERHLAELRPHAAREGLRDTGAGEAGKPPAARESPVSHADSAHAAGKAEGTGMASPPEEKSGPPGEDRSLAFGQNGDFPFVIPDSASASGRKLLEAYGMFRKERFQKAVTLLKEAVLAYGGSDNAEAAPLDMASIYIKLGLWDQARSLVLDYLAGSPKDLEKYRGFAHYLLALVHLAAKDGEKAEKTLLKIKAGEKVPPSPEEVDYRLAQAGEHLQDLKKRSAYLEKAQASAQDPHRKASLFQQLGFLHSKHGNLDRGLDYFRKSAQDCKDSALAAICAESELRVADTEFRRKRWQAALDQYRKFSGKYPGHAEAPWVHYQIANAYKAVNNFESALNEYKRVIDNYPDSYWAAQARWKREDTIWQKEYEEVLD
jgi:tetratricopeptide (TPR) repeat protein